MVMRSTPATTKMKLLLATLIRASEEKEEGHVKVSPTKQVQMMADYSNLLAPNDIARLCNNKRCEPA
jgi:hypothetical protein